MSKELFDRQWRFKPVNKSEHYWLNQENQGNQEEMTVDLPHDFSIGMRRDPKARSGASGGFFQGDVAVYEKTLYVPEEWRGKKVLLEFEGVYMNGAVRINSQLIAQHPYGYTSFHCDCTPYLLYGEENLITVTVNNDATPNSRWYSGSGIYRHVWLMIKEPVHIKPWGVFAVTPVVSEEKSKVLVKTSVDNTLEQPADVTVRSVLLTEEGAVAAGFESSLTIGAVSEAEASQEFEVSPAQLWSVDNPRLYTLQVELVKEGDVVDSYKTKIGVRQISFHVQTGFQLNGKTVKLKGGCVHHDCGLLGSAAYDRAEERKVELLKASGYNAVRCAHNPPSPAFLDACDRLGMLVIDEAFDGWREPKRASDYGNYFESWWKRDMASMLLRDRNHPCIIMWSTGNEVWEKDGRSEGYRYAAELAAYVRSFDTTRPVTNAVNFIWEPGSPMGLPACFKSEGKNYWAELTEKFMEPLDVAGYNYLHTRYEEDGKRYPQRLICGTETYPKTMFESWCETERLPHVIGDFVWSSLDYLGEAGIGQVRYDYDGDFHGDYPWSQAFCGDIDICGVKRPQSYYRDCLWGVSKAPYMAVYKPEHYGKEAFMSLWGWPDVTSSWTWDGFEGKPIVIDVYCVNSEVELLVNGKSLGRKPCGKRERYIATFEGVYEPGELAAIGYENGVAVSRSTLRTAGKPVALRLTPDRDKLKAGFGELSYIKAEVVDAAGQVVYNGDNNIYFTVYGPGKLLAVGSGNPKSEEIYVGNQRRAYEGWAMAVVRADGDPGSLILTASSEGLQTAEVLIQVGNMI